MFLINCPAPFTASDKPMQQKTEIMKLFLDCLLKGKCSSVKLPFISC